MHHKPKVFYLAWTPPNNKSGATLAMYRHFIQHDDFEVFVCTDGEFNTPGVPYCALERPAVIRRAGDTRFARLVRQYEMLVLPYHFVSAVITQINSFRPDLVFTVADNTLSWTARVAARKLGLPLVVNFQDWWPRGQFYYELEKPYRFTRALLERRFRRLYRESALSFCTSEGMKEFLGPHPNSHVLYPIPAPRRHQFSNTTTSASAKRRFRLLYTGTPFRSYGSLIRELIVALKALPDWSLEVYGAKPDWPEEEYESAKKVGIYRGFLPFEKLVEEMQGADAFLAIMSFDSNLEIMMRTSFTTKFLDYAALGKPIIVWGPDFCSPVKLARRMDAAEVVTSPDPKAVVDSLRRISADAELRARLSEKALELAATEFDHTRIHAILSENIREVAADFRRQTSSSAEDTRSISK